MSAVVRRIRNLLVNKLRQRARWNGRLLASRLQRFEQVLDFGCGDMATAQYLHAHARIQIIGIDTIDIRLPYTRYLPFVRYNGGRLPFDSGQFDVAVAAYSLHHTDDPRYYLGELSRVARRLLIMENTFHNRLQKLLVCCQDLLGNRLESWEMAVPFNFHSRQEWMRMFLDMDMVLVHHEPVQSRFGLRFTPNFLAEVLSADVRDECLLPAGLATSTPPAMSAHAGRRTWSAPPPNAGSASA